MEDRKFLFRLFAIATSFIYEAVAAIGIGFLLGRWLDNALEYENVFIIVFMFIGALAAVRNLMVRVYRLGARKDD